MRASLSCNVHVHRFGVWRGWVALLASVAVASLLAWAIGREAIGSRWVDAALVLVGLASAGIALGAARVEPGRLALRGGVWTFAPDGQGDAAVRSGEIEVAIDAGAFLLLRFVPVVASGAPLGRARWLPVQRRGLEADWHALRCAVYSPRLAAAESASGATRPAPE